MTAARKGRPRGRGQVPTPGEVGKTIDQVIEQLVQAKVAYDWCHSVAYGKAVIGDAGGVRSGVGDPTGDIATAKARDTVRYACRVAGSDLADALADVRSAVYMLDRAMIAVDPPPSANLALADQYRVSRAELADSRAAKTRRAERGEGWGEG